MYKKSLIISTELKEIMVVLLLRNGKMQTFSKIGKTGKLRIIQGGENYLDYINHLRNVFDDWTEMPIRENHECVKDKNKLHRKWYFNILYFEQFSESGNTFYKWDEENRKIWYNHI